MALAHVESQAWNKYVGPGSWLHSDFVDLHACSRSFKQKEIRPKYQYGNQATSISQKWSAMAAIFFSVELSFKVVVNPYMTGLR